LTKSIISLLEYLLFTRGS